MKITSGLTCLLLILASSFSLMSQDKGGVVRLRIKQPKSSSAQPETLVYENSYALLIGNSQYQDPAWPDLIDVPREISAVKDVLENAHGFKTELALNLTREFFLNRIDQFISRYGQKYDSRVVVYFSGHGYTSLLPDGRKMGYLVMPDAPPMPDEQDALKNPPTDAQFEHFLPSAITMDEIETYAKRFSAKHVLFVFDSCFSGTVLYRSGNADRPNELTSEELKPVRAYLTAGNETQRVPAFSTFSRKLVAGLKGDADSNHDGYILSSELARWISLEVERETAQRQTPVFGKSDSFRRGDLVFVSPPASPLPTPTPSIVIGDNKSLRVLYVEGVVDGGSKLKAGDVFQYLESFNPVLKTALEKQGLNVSTLGNLDLQDLVQYLGAINARYTDSNALKSFQFALFVKPEISLEDLGTNAQGAFIALATGTIPLISTDNGQTIFSQSIGPTRGYGSTKDEARKNALRAAALSIPNSFYKFVAEKAR